MANMSQKALNYYKDLFSYNRMKQIHDPSLFVYFEYIGLPNRTWLYSDIMPAIARKKVADIVHSSKLLVLKQLQLRYGMHATCYKVKQPVKEPWLNVDLIIFSGHSNKYLYKAFQSFGFYYNAL